MKSIWAEQAFTSEGWKHSVRVDIDDQGVISAVTPDAAPTGHQTGILLPAPANLHSHAFQRAMAGLTEARGPDGQDSFWTWRTLMYRFLEHLDPDDIEAIAAFAQMEMLEAGYACVAEFHYLHHQPDGAPYDNIAELSARIAAASARSGIGLTLLPVCYEQGGCDGRPLTGGQKRFGNDRDRFARLHDTAGAAMASLSADAVLGVAVHSLRAVPPDSLSACAALYSGGPVHIHIAEQLAEIEEVKNAYGQTPVAWLLDQQDVDDRWCLVHATHMIPEETEALAHSRATAGLCPVTEANLGDGIFDGVRFLTEGGSFGVGTDSNINISFTEELRLLEYSQRLRDKGRAVLANPDVSTGRVLFEGAANGGAQASGRNSGAIENNRFADLLALDAEAVDLSGKQGDQILDTYIFAGSDNLVRDVWSAGRHMVRDGQHIHRSEITDRYRKTITSLRDQL